MFPRYTTWHGNCSLLRCSGFAPTAGVNRFKIFRTVVPGGRRILINPMHRTVHLLSLRSLFCKRFRAGPRSATPQGGVENEQDARLLVRFRSSGGACAAEGNTLLPHKFFRRGGIWQARVAYG